MGRTNSIAFLLVLVTLFYQTEVSNSTEVVELVTKNDAYYHAKITWTIKNFLNLPGWSMQSPYFPEANKGGLQWFLIAVTSSPRDQSNDFDLLAYSLGHQNSNITNLSVGLECAVIDARGNKQLKKSKERYNILNPGGTPFYFTPFVSRETLRKNQTQLLPNGHLTFECNLEGFIIRAPNNDTKSYLTTIEKSRPEVPSDCAKKIAERTMRKLNAGGYQLKSDILLKASDGNVRGHKAILSPLWSKLGSVNATELDLSAHLNITELLNMRRFLYTGYADHLRDDAERMYGIAKIFDLLCLQKVCEDFLIEKLGNNKVHDLLSFADANGAVNLKKACIRCIANGKC